MTHDEIRSAILASSELTALVRVNTQAVADALSIGKVKRIEFYASLGTPMKYLGPEAGAALLDTMETLSESNPVVKWGFKLLERGELDLGLDSTRAMLDALLPPEAAAALKGLAEVPDAVTVSDVLAAMEGI